MLLQDLFAKSAADIPLTDAEAAWLAAWDENNLAPLLNAADRLKRLRFGNTIEFCGIINAKSGKCSQDCAFCAQSARHDTGVNIYPFVDLDTLDEAIVRASKAGVRRFAIVTSGKDLQDADFVRFLEGIRRIARAGLIPDASVGLLTPERLDVLRKAGLRGLHHNLETAREFYPNICSTRTFEDNFATVRNAVKAGFEVCSGGIFGLGESWAERISLARSIAEAGAHSVPVNFLNPIPGTRLERQPILRPAEAIKIVAVLRFLLPTRHIRICGGRATVFTPSERKRLLIAGASGLMAGDYLTTSGVPIQDDLQDLEELGLKRFDQADLNCKM